MVRKNSASDSVQKAGMRRELERETKKILRLKGEVARSFWDLGDSLCRVQDKKLYQAKGYQTFEEYLEKGVKIGRTNAYQLMKLARNFSREIAIKYGKEKLLCAIDYAKATPEPDLPLDVTRYTIPAKNRAGKAIEKTFKQASVRDIKRAAALLKKKLKPQKPQASLPVPDLAALLSGKTPKFTIKAFLPKARQKLKDLTPPPKLSAAITQKGEEPLVDLRLTGVRVSQLTEAFGLLAAAAVEVWTESLQ